MPLGLRSRLRFRLPHPLLLLLGGVIVAALLTWVLPAGAFERRSDAALGRDVVVPGTFAITGASPVGPFATLLAVPRGMADGVDVLLTILFVGAAFALLDATGALGRLVGTVVQRARRPRLVVLGMTLAFATLGALDNTQEEIVALIPPLLVLSRGLGFGPLTALAMSVGAASVGSAFGPTNPFMTGIALRFAELPPMSQPWLRVTAFVIALVLWCTWVLVGMRREARDRVGERLSATAIGDGPAPPGVPVQTASRRDLALLIVALVPFAPYVYGVLRWDWGFHELSALFLLTGFVLGTTAGLSLAQTTEGLLDGMKQMLPATLYVGVARAIGVVLQDGHVLDTIVYGLSLPLTHVAPVIAPVLLIPVHAVLHVVVPSNSGQAALTMPIMAPLSDLLGVSRDAAVFAYQTGAGLADTIIPTNGAVLAMLATAGVSIGRWVRFAAPGLLLVALVGVAAVLVAA
jgi:uncharacterized ion transporter superfamily protein YfcC